MGSNSFGTLFRISTWGESHGKAIGALIDGCPAGLSLNEEEINEELRKRRPGLSSYTSARLEMDRAEILSGVFEGKTTGTPISIIIFNQDLKSAPYENIKKLIRPGHANYPYLKKYGIFDHRGGGRASARETACRVAAGAVAKKLLQYFNISLTAFVKEMGEIQVESLPSDIKHLKKKTLKSSIFCPDSKKEKKMIEMILKAKEEKDSLGGIIECVTSPLPVGLGDPIYEKLEANLAKAMLSLPATKGFEIGAGFRSAKMKGSEHNDLFVLDRKQNIKTKTNHSGGTLGGISIGMPLLFRVAFKPTSSIAMEQKTLDLEKKERVLTLGKEFRFDPCVVIRAVPVIEAMCALVLADSLLMNRSSSL
ncbi:MAG: chorismate synthase [Simkania negevensis]|nr:chorismate synthase [Simkania negevensis]